MALDQGALPEPRAPQRLHDPAEFHRTISDQLNARLSESPRFFWAVVAVAAGYGYTLWNYPKCTVGSYQHLALVLASLGAFTVAALAEWYIAALGYGFRFLQAAQFDIEHYLGWKQFGLPRGESKKCPWADPFWLLPSIYLPHVFTFFGIMLLVALGSWAALRTRWALVGVPIAIAACYLPNVYYLCKFRKKRKRWAEQRLAASRLARRSRVTQL